MPMRTALRSVPPMARSMAWAPLAGAAAAVAALVAVQRPWDDHGVTLALARLAVVTVAIGATFALDDDAAVTLASSPTSLLWRRAVRAALALTASAAVVAVVALLAVGPMGGTESVPLGRLAIEAAGMLLLAMALSAALGGDRAAFAFAGGILAAVVVQHRWPSYSLFPFAPGAPGWSRAAAVWAAVAVASTAVLFLLSRER